MIRRTFLAAVASLPFWRKSPVQTIVVKGRDIWCRHEFDANPAVCRKCGITAETFYRDQQRNLSPMVIYYPPGNTERAKEILEQISQQRRNGGILTIPQPYQIEYLPSIIPYDPA